MVMLPYGLAEVMTESGINQALVQTKKEVKTYLSTVWLALIGRGMVISWGLWLAAPWVSRFFNADLTLGLRLVALTPLVKGFVNPAVVLFRKYALYSREFYFQAIASVAESLATIGLVLTWKSFLALPLGVVAGGAASLILSFLLVRVYWSALSWQKLRELYAYGKWVTAGTLLSYLNDQGDDLLVGKVLGAQFLGFYQTAYKISNLPTTQGAGLVYQIIFPLFSQIQTDHVRLKRGLVKALLVTFGLSLGFAVGVWLAAPVLINWLLGRRWLAMVPALNVLLLYGLMRPLVSVSSALFDAVGAPQVATGMNLIKLIVLALLIWPLTSRWELVGTAWAVVIAQASSLPWYGWRLISFFPAGGKKPGR
jgi:O-antigen/teichoic acid export membrane protein